MMWVGTTNVPAETWWFSWIKEYLSHPNPLEKLEAFLFLLHSDLLSPLPKKFQQKWLNFKTTKNDLVLNLSQDFSKGLVYVYWEIALQKVEKC